MSKHAIIVGGGMGGLAAAARLAHRGWRVTLIEKNARVGGKLNLWEAAHPYRPQDRPFRFDTGPSLLTMPQVFRELFKDVGEDFDRRVTIEKLDPIARYVWADGKSFDARANPLELSEEVKKKFPHDAAGFDTFMEEGRKIWDLSAELFLYHAPEQVLAGRMNGKAPARQSGLEKLKAAWNLLSVPFRIGMFTPFHRLIDRHVSDQRLREILYQYATYSGASPFKAPATLAVIPYAEFHFGGWYVKGGMYQLAEAVAALAREKGVEIHTGCAVKQIVIVDNGGRGAREHRTSPEPGTDSFDQTRKSSIGVKPADASRQNQRTVRGVILEDGTQLFADVVLCNSDVVYTYRTLIALEHRPKFTDRTLAKLEPGGSGMVLLLGIEGRYPQLAHHTKFMPADYSSDLRAMFQTHAIPDDPCLYVCASTRSDPTQAPPGCENLFVLCSAPALDGRIDWREASQRYRDRIVHTLENRFGLTDLSKRIVVERQINPSDLESLYNANAGSIYGIGSNSRRTAFLRPPNRDKHVRGLYFAGGATHPGGGLPLVTLSGKIAAELIAEDFG